jgi:hypothetical protein
MASSQLETLQWQFGLAWRLAGYHLPALTDAACLWEPARQCWTVHQGADGKWRPDWAETEPDPVPATTIGWLTWHLIWWWSGALRAVRDESAIPREEVFWPGSADGVREKLEMLSRDWSAMLAGLTDADLEKPFAHPWTEPRPFRIALAWANAELMKNVAEIGTMRHLYEISRHCA